MSKTVGSHLVVALAWLAAAGCSKLEQKECDKIRGDAFDMLNKAQHCNNDADCGPSDWPGCAKPLSNKTAEEMKPLSESYTKGQCEEPKSDCKTTPEVYCKQGLCVFREKSAPGAVSPPNDSIKIQ